MEKFWLDKKYQREIKFRLWKLRESRMIPWEEAMYFDLSWLDKEINNKKFVPMMYAGLQGNKDDDLYEFDIVKFNDDYSDSLYVLRFGQYWNGEEYEYGESGYGWFATQINNLNVYDEEHKKAAEKSGNSWGENIYGAFEILGNPFENPELIEQC